MNHHATCYLSPANSGNMNLPAVLMAAWANDHDRQASVGAVVEPGQNHRFCQNPNENWSGGRWPGSEISLQMPGSPDNSEHQCRPEGIETTLQPRKREIAPAHLLKQSNDDDRREQSYADPQPISVGPDVRRWPTSRDRECSRDRSQTKGTQQCHDIPDWMYASEATVRARHAALSIPPPAEQQPQPQAVARTALAGCSPD